MRRTAMKHKKITVHFTIINPRYNLKKICNSHKCNSLLLINDIKNKSVNKLKVQQAKKKRKKATTTSTVRNEDKHKGKTQMKKTEKRKKTFFFLFLWVQLKIKKIRY